MKRKPGRVKAMLLTAGAVIVGVPSTAFAQAGAQVEAYDIQAQDLGIALNELARQSNRDGLEVDARYGFAEDYHSFNGNLTFGRAWSTGSAYVSYTYAYRDDILGKDRDYIQSINWVTGVPAGRQCAVGNVQVSTRIYGLPGFALSQPNVCDPTDDQTIVPEERRHNLFAGFSQDIGDRVKLDVRGFYTTRDTDANAGPLAASVTVRRTNPFYRNLAGADAGAAQSVQFNYAPINGTAAGVNLTRLRQWGVTPSITVDLPGGWQLRAFTNLSESHLLDWQRYGFARSRLVNHRAVGSSP